MSKIERARELLCNKYDSDRRHHTEGMVAFQGIRASAHELTSMIVKLKYRSDTVASISPEEMTNLVDQMAWKAGHLAWGLDDYELNYCMADDSNTLLIIDEHLVEEVERRDAIHDRTVRVEVWQKTNGKCCYCRVALRHPYHDGKGEEEAKPVMHVDHVVPKACGGPDHIANYAPSCPTCNMAKSEKDVVKFISSVKKMAGGGR